MTKGRMIVDFQQINEQFVPDEANTHKVRVSSSIDVDGGGYRGRRNRSSNGSRLLSEEINIDLNCVQAFCDPV